MNYVCVQYSCPKNQVKQHEPRECGLQESNPAPPWLPKHSNFGISGLITKVITRKLLKTKQAHVNL